MSNNGESIFLGDIFNQLGSKVKTIISQSYNSRIEFNMDGFLPGMYLIRVKSEKDTQFKDVVLKAVKLK